MEVLFVEYISNHLKKKYPATNISIETDVFPHNNNIIIYLILFDTTVAVLIRKSKRKFNKRSASRKLK